jgi:hypothetical protein
MGQKLLAPLSAEKHRPDRLARGFRLVALMLLISPRGGMDGKNPLRSSSNQTDVNGIGRSRNLSVTAICFQQVDFRLPVIRARLLF